VAVPGTAPASAASLLHQIKAMPALPVFQRVPAAAEAQAVQEL
jgi:hypothetical protein